MEMKVAVILSEAKDLQFRFEANQCRFFASLRMTDFRESKARNLALSLPSTKQSEVPRFARNDIVPRLSPPSTFCFLSSVFQRTLIRTIV
jgi:hypothetical protein